MLQKVRFCVFSTLCFTQMNFPLGIKNYPDFSTIRAIALWECWIRDQWTYRYIVLLYNHCIASEERFSSNLLDSYLISSDKPATWKSHVSWLLLLKRAYRHWSLAFFKLSICKVFNWTLFVTTFKCYSY